MEMEDCKKEFDNRLEAWGEITGETSQIRRCIRGRRDLELTTIDGGKETDSLGPIGFSLEMVRVGTEGSIRGEIAVDRDYENATVEAIERHEKCIVTDIHHHKERRGLTSHIHILCDDPNLNMFERLISSL